MSNSTTSKLVNSVRRAKDPKAEEKVDDSKTTASTPAKKSEDASEKPRVISSHRTWPD